MTIGAYKYLVKGLFEGTFSTLQDEPILHKFDLPEGDEHKIVFHRGIIQYSTQISEEDYINSAGVLNFSEIKNIEIQKSSFWPLQHDRIFTLQGAKVADFEISQVQELNGKTVATFKGTIYAKVCHSEFIHPETDRELDEENLKYRKHQWNEDQITNNQGCQFPNLDGCTSRVQGCTQGGCNNRSGCTRWLLFLLLGLLLLWMIGRCTQFGQTLHCYYQQWKEKRELSKLKSENDALLEKIRRTKKEIKPCGKITDPNGKNIPKSYTFDLGKKSGTVTLKYSMYDIPDRIELIYDGQLVAYTNDQSFKPIIVRRKRYALDHLVPMGYAQGDGTLRYDYNYNSTKPTELLVRVIPSQEFEQTKWTIDIFCP